VPVGLTPGAPPLPTDPNPGTVPPLPLSPVPPDPNPGGETFGGSPASAADGKKKDDKVTIIMARKIFFMAPHAPSQNIS
jgi:hypothetical protein